MRVTVLGKSPVFADVGGACSGYLVQEGSTTLAMDFGNGVFGKLRAFVDFMAVDAVVVSHMHSDHILDIVPFAYALTYAPGAGSRQKRVRLLLPTGGRDVIRGIVGAWGTGDLVESAFDVAEYASGDELEIGDLCIRTQAVPHYMPHTNAFDVSPRGGGRRLTYGADHGPSEELVDFARDTDLLLIEAGIPEPEADGPRGHITPREAGEHGRRAGAARLVVTHVSDLIDQAWVRAESEAAFGGPVTIAAEGDVYEI